MWKSSGVFVVVNFDQWKSVDDWVEYMGVMRKANLHGCIRREKIRGHNKGLGMWILKMWKFVTQNVFFIFSRMTMNLGMDPEKVKRMLGTS